MRQSADLIVLSIAIICTCACTKRDGKPGEAKLIIPFTNPEIVGRFVFHCHVVKHEDKSMMMTVEVVQ